MSLLRIVPGIFFLLFFFLTPVEVQALERVPNSTLRFPLQPPLYGFTTADAFPGLTFSRPVCITAPPNETNRLFIVEQPGRIVVITNLASPNRSVFLDLGTRVSGGASGGDESGLLSMTFHPGYATNGYFYIFYTLQTNTVGARNLHDRLARFQVSPTNPNAALPNSEQPLITQHDEASNHNAGDLHFGPDNYLYVSLGDEGAGNDSFNNSQRIDKDFFSGILRLDVDKRPGNLPPNSHPSVSPDTYFVPADNPYVGVTSFNGASVAPAKVHTEFWAVGLRNPWRFSFDPATGRLYCGDVGQGAREEVDLIVKGGNYGWSYREGLIAGPRTAAPAGVNFINPIADYDRSQGQSITGGLVYRGLRLSQLTGAYVYSDYVSGLIWSLVYNGTNATQRQLLTTDAGIAGFGTDPRNQDLLLADLAEGKIKRLDYNSIPVGSPVPTWLDQTGVFTNLSTLTPHAGIVPYEVNLPFWSDGATKTRWFSLPNTHFFFGFNPTGNWTFPSGSLWIKHFELRTNSSLPGSARRLETRLLIKNNAGVFGATYRWTSATNAQLVPEEGLDETLTITEGGTNRTQVWHYPARNECLQCHTAAGGHALGFQTAQLNRPISYNGNPEIQQLQALVQAGYFTPSNAPSHASLLRRMIRPEEDAASLESRVRSYLAVNCSFCHQPGGTALGNWDGRLFTPLSQAGLVQGALVNPGSHPNNRVIVPGSATHSMLLTRLKSVGPGQMPPLARTLPDPEAIALLEAWILQGLSNYQSWADWQSAHFGAPTVPEADSSADPDQDGASNQLEYLTGTLPRQNPSVWQVSPLPGAGVSFTQVANRGFEVQYATNLAAPTLWLSLDAPENVPYYSITNREVRVIDPTPNLETRFYRVRVYEP